MKKHRTGSESVSLSSESGSEVSSDLLCLDKVKIAKKSINKPAFVKRTSIPVDLQRFVRKRAGDRCEFVSSQGLRCSSTHRLEFEHVVPVALGGRADGAQDLKLFCRSHNLCSAKVCFGPWVNRYFKRPF